MRRSPKVAEVLPVLYLRGLSTGDFRPALEGLLGKDAAGLSATTVVALCRISHTILSGLDLISLPADAEVELSRGACRQTSQDSGICGKRKWYPREVVDAHSRCDHD